MLPFFFHICSSRTPRTNNLVVPTHLFTSTDNAAPCQTILERRLKKDFPNGLSSKYDFPCNSVYILMNPNASNTCFLPRSACSTEPSLINSEALIRVHSLKDLRVIFHKTAMYASHISTHVKDLQEFPVQMENLRHFKVKWSTTCSFVYHCVISDPSLMFCYF